MSLPGNALAVVPQKAPLFSPDDLGRPNRTIDFERGGVALNDATQGQNVNTYRLRLVGNDVRIGIFPVGTETTVFTEAGITQLTLCFDQNMRPTVGYVAFNIAKLYWYDSSIPGTTTSTIGAGVTSPFLTQDDKREGQTGTNDMLLFFLRANRLVYAQQRERFLIERTLRWFAGSAVTISKVGMNKINRIQIELAGANNAVDPFVYLPSWTVSTYRDAATSITVTLPSVISTGGLVFVAVMARSAITPPAGWTVLQSVDCSSAATALQRLTVFTKDSVAPSDQSTAHIFTQSSSLRMGIVACAAKRDGGNISVAASSTSTVASTSTNTVTPPAVTSTQNGQLVLTFATSINGVTAATTPTPPTNTSLWSGTAGENRLAAAYHLLDNTSSSAGAFTFDNGGPTNNGLAAVTVRLQKV